MINVILIILIMLYLSVENFAKIHQCLETFTPILGSSLKEGFDDYYISTSKHFEDLLRNF